MRPPRRASLSQPTPSPAGPGARRPPHRHPQLRLGDAFRVGPQGQGQGQGQDWGRVVPFVGAPGPSRMHKARPVGFRTVACPSGQRSTPRKRVWGQLHRGFESHRHRQGFPGETRVPWLVKPPCSFSGSGGFTVSGAAGTWRGWCAVAPVGQGVGCAASVFRRRWGAGRVLRWGLRHDWQPGCRGPSGCQGCASGAVRGVRGVSRGACSSGQGRCCRPRRALSAVVRRVEARTWSRSVVAVRVAQA